MKTTTKPHKRTKARQPQAYDFLPQDEKSLGILAARAARLATPLVATEQLQDGVSYIKFALSKDDFYGIPYQYAYEMIAYTRPTPLPAVPGYIEGVINRRGLLLSVINLGAFFNLNSGIAHQEPDSIIIVEGAHSMAVGITANQVQGNQIYDHTKLDSPLAQHQYMGVKPEYVIGLDQGKITILNVEAILSDLAKTYHSGKGELP